MFLIAESVIVLDPTSSFYLISEISLLWAPFTFANGWCSHFNSTGHELVKLFASGNKTELKSASYFIFSLMEVIPF